MTEHKLMINNLEFAKNAQEAKGQLALSGLPRVCEWLESLGALPEMEGEAGQNEIGMLDYQLHGHEDAAGQHFLNLNLSISANLVCQRCFELMEVEETLTFEYLLTPMEEAEILNEVGEMGDDYDLLTIEREMDLQALFEDEVIAAIPYAPMHREMCQMLKKESGEKPNPFAALKKLKT